MEQDRLSHAYIITGSPAEAEARGTALAAEMLCSAAGKRPCGLCRSCVKVKKGIHPDILFTRRLTDEKGKLRREIYVDQIREISETALVLPNESEKKVYIIADAGTMNPSAQNALLKLLEEPPRFDAFLLLCDNADQLLETVRSRCVTLHLNTQEAPPADNVRQLSQHYVAAAAKKDLAALVSFLNANSEMSAGEAGEWIRSNLSLLTDILCGRQPDPGLGQPELMRLAALQTKAQEYLRSNVSVKHIFGLFSARTIDLNERN